MTIARRTLRRRVEHEIAKRKGSRFITAAWPLEQGAVAGCSANGNDNSRELAVQTQVKAMLEQRRLLIPSACHHCYAYTTMDGLGYCSDDGEPHGTAGKPILSVLERAHLVDVCVVVSRIFGGTKLGTGGLIRAYGAAAQEAIDHAELVDTAPSTMLHVTVPFRHVALVKQGCTRVGADIVSQEYADGATFSIRVRVERVESLADFMQSQSAGAIQITAPQQPPAAGS